ncbi:MAG: CPBP family intramembrane metalloprotease [Anaerolineae bacterium]|nr:CPBP family intramembrane metalloprotease [Anaerolineae bacterium]
MKQPHSTEISPPNQPIPMKNNPARWVEFGAVMGGTFLIFLVLDRSASWLGSLRGEAGLLVCALVIATSLLVERLFFKTRIRQAVQRLGLGYPTPQVIGVTLLASLGLLAFFPLFSLVTGAAVSLRSDWMWLALGLFAQHGLAEELLFRGFAFGHLRRGRTFWRAAWLSLIPFVAVHLLLLNSLSLPLALTSISLAVASSLPLAYLFDRGRRTIWGPALLHFAIHVIKLVNISEAFYTSAALAWMVVCAVVPYLVFAFPPIFFTPDRSADSEEGPA